MKTPSLSDHRHGQGVDTSPPRQSTLGAVAGNSAAQPGRRLAEYVCPISKLTAAPRMKRCSLKIKAYLI